MPCDYSKYPANWKTEIRPAILKRAKDCCEICGLKNGLLISRDNKNGLVKDLIDGPVWEYDEMGKLVHSDVSWRLSDWDSFHHARVVLTIAHLDHDVKNNDYGNLQALCQKCHLDLDRVQHRTNARNTVNNKKGLQDMFK